MSNLGLIRIPEGKPEWRQAIDCVIVGSELIGFKELKGGQSRLLDSYYVSFAVLGTSYLLSHFKVKENTRHIVLSFPLRSPHIRTVWRKKEKEKRSFISWEALDFQAPLQTLSSREREIT